MILRLNIGLSTLSERLPYQHANLHTIVRLTLASIRRLIGTANQRHLIYLKYRNSDRNRDADSHPLFRRTSNLLDYAAQALATAAYWSQTGRISTNSSPS